MSKLRLLFTASTFACLLCVSCDKDSDSIDCTIEATRFDLNHTFDIQSVRTVIFELEYSGNNMLDDAIAWDFGDSTTEIGNGSTIQHTFGNPGTFQVKATVTVRNGSKSCSSGILSSVEVF